ncbi:ABC transporter ATP-binding protein [soil metagenome]
MSSSPLLTLRDLSVTFPASGTAATPARPAVDRLALSVYPNQTLAVVGESGCGKSITALALMGLLPRGAHVSSGTAHFRAREGDTELLHLPARDLRRLRGRDLAMIFQEPMTSLNPVFTIGDQLTEAISLHREVFTDDPRRLNRTAANDIAVAALEEVGITGARARLGAYPHEFSGGMRQRVMIAMALACGPRLLLADEPPTALDVTVQRQVLELLTRLQHQRAMAVLLITHALGVVAAAADVVCVMYAGRVVEYARVDHLFARPLHPYTRGLLASIPRLHAPRTRLNTIAHIVSEPAEFAMLPGDLRPWWPWHPTPPATAELIAGEHAAGVAPSPHALRPDAAFAPIPQDSRLVELEPAHWVRVWRGAATAALPHSEPDIPWQRSRTPDLAPQSAS